jgi:hypothetical protein
MNSTDLARVVQEQGRPLVESLYSELRSNLGTSHYHRLSNDELLRRGQAVYQRLAHWLDSPDNSSVHDSGAELGKKRFSEGIPLGQVVLALILEEKHLWDYLGLIGLKADEKLRLKVAEFFARTIYGTALGYENALAESNRRARRDLSPAKPIQPAATRVPTTEEKQTLQISRGGQVGEFGG